MLDFFVKEIDIEELHSKSCFPDWLGHIGLLLSSCEKAEAKSQKLSRVLLPQFKEILKADEHIIEKIDQMIKNNHPITKEFLGEVELYFSDCKK